MQIKSSQSFLVVQWVKHLALTLQWPGLQLWHRFDPWLGNFHMMWMWPKKILIMTQRSYTVCLQTHQFLSLVTVLQLLCFAGRTLPQSLCTCCILCPESSSSRCPSGLFFYFIFFSLCLSACQRKLYYLSCSKEHLYPALFFFTSLFTVHISQQNIRSMWKETWSDLSSFICSGSQKPGVVQALNKYLGNG